jgi:hypothetical protein
VKALASRGADVNVQVKDGVTPLLIAAIEGHLEVVGALASLGADVNLPANDGRTPLHASAGRPSATACVLLLAIGGDVDARDAKGRTAADIASAVCDPEVVSLFRPTARVVEAAGRPCLDCGQRTRLRISSETTCNVCGAGVEDLRFACPDCDFTFCGDCAPPPKKGTSRETTPPDDPTSLTSGGSRAPAVSGGVVRSRASCRSVGWPMLIISLVVLMIWALSR